MGIKLAQGLEIADMLLSNYSSHYCSQRLRIKIQFLEAAVIFTELLVLLQTLR